MKSKEGIEMGKLAAEGLRKGLEDSGLTNYMSIAATTEIPKQRPILDYLMVRRDQTTLDERYNYMVRYHTCDNEGFSMHHLEEFTSEELSEMNKLHIRMMNIVNEVMQRSE